ncbi:MAG: carbamoyltransferase HypF [Clostridium sp.]|uniref:carbamoyltransferase HypF n=1 Tax=Clostridium sp. TaxID=1506 RepID=UPI003053A46C
MDIKEIVVKGLVQGVGFRPFIYRIALENKLKGWVKNTASGVVIQVQGDMKDIENFHKNIIEKSPRLSCIEAIEIKELKLLKEFSEFIIMESSDENCGTTLISSDIATCKECEEELLDKNNRRRYRYPFTNCTNCGPRFSIIKAVPYDRKYTTMETFEMCSDCRAEYEDPSNRRFHAEPTCCFKCGPKVTLLDKKGEILVCADEIEQVRKLLKEGKIIGIKGLGGINLICDGENFGAVEELRVRKHRKKKPLALMMRDEDIVHKYCYINEKERSILTGNKKPILLLRKNNNRLPHNISFENSRLGVLLPYTPLHYLLFDEALQVIVFTSGNESETPIIYNNSEAIDNLGGIVDYLLLHDREINMPIDDSVTSVVLNEERLIRGARGYAPFLSRNKLYYEESVLALGSQFKNRFSISTGVDIFTSPHIGDMESFECYNRFLQNLEHMKKIYKIEPSIVAYDMHPNYWYDKYLEEFKGIAIGVYHHHSHIVSCMAENQTWNKVIGIAFDGVGYGEDGNLWGGEFLICDSRDFLRGAHINYFATPSGDGAVKSPWKIGISLLYKALNEDSKDELRINNEMNLLRYYLGKYFKDKPTNIIVNMVEKKINSPLSSSMGRFFDGVASLLGFLDDVSYEGEAAMYLQNISENYMDSITDLSNYKYEEHYCYDIELQGNSYIINTNKIVIGVLEDLEKFINVGEIASKFHNTIVEFSSEISIKLREIYNINTVALSGGVFQNEILLIRIKNKLEAGGFRVLTHKLIPCNDGGLSIGQIIIANEYRNK